MYKIFVLADLIGEIVVQMLLCQVSLYLFALSQDLRICSIKVHLGIDVNLAFDWLLAFVFK